MSPQLWSWMLAAVGILGIWLAGRKQRAGWLVGVAAQLLWIAYAITTRQWGFLVTAFAYGAVYIRNWLRWGREARTPAPASAPAPPAPGTPMQLLDAYWRLYRNGQIDRNAAAMAMVAAARVTDVAAQAFLDREVPPSQQFVGEIRTSPSGGGYMAMRWREPDGRRER